MLIACNPQPSPVMSIETNSELSHGELEKPKGRNQSVAPSKHVWVCLPEPIGVNNNHEQIDG